MNRSWIKISKDYQVIRTLWYVYIELPSIFNSRNNNYLLQYTDSNWVTMSTNHYNFLNQNIHSNDCTNYNTHNLITLTILIWISMIILYHYWFIVTGKMFWSNIDKFLKTWERIWMFTSIIMYSYISTDNNMMDTMEIKSFYSFSERVLRTSDWQYMITNQLLQIQPQFISNILIHQRCLI